VKTPTPTPTQEALRLEILHLRGDDPTDRVRPVFIQPLDAACTYAPGLVRGFHACIMGTPPRGEILCTELEGGGLRVHVWPGAGLAGRMVNPTRYGFDTNSPRYKELVRLCGLVLAELKAQAKERAGQ
jgi:hypothetical protein